METIAPTSESSQFSRGYIIALASAAVLSTTAILIRYLTQTFAMPALVLAFWRDLFVAFSLLPILASLRPALLRVPRTQLLFLIAYGLILSVFNGLWTLSVAINGAAIATVLAYSSAGFTASLGWWLLKERLDAVKLLAVLLSLGGCILVAEALDARAWSANLLGILTGIFSGLLYAAYSLMGRSAAQRGLNPWTTLLYTFFFAGVFLFGSNLLPGEVLPGAAVQISDFGWLGTSLAGWGALFLLAAGPTLAGFGLYNISLSLLPSSVANLIVTTEPAFTAVLAFFLFGERLKFVQIVGTLIILSGVILLRWHEGRFAGARQLNH